MRFDGIVRRTFPTRAFASHAAVASANGTP
jgi:hypothetical protein